MATAIHFRDAVSLAGRFPLLSGITFDVQEGDIVHLRGPNGAGKTSLLRACAGLVAISEGEAVVLGHDLRGDLGVLRREVGLFGHTSFLYEELSVEENLRFIARAARVELSRVDGAIERLGIAGRLRGEVVGKLSTGQRRRAALAALVVRSPRLWLLDEPHAGLDEEGRTVVDELVVEVRANGATVVFSSHEADRAARLADIVVEIDGGYATALPSLRAEPHLSFDPIDSGVVLSEAGSDVA